MKKESTIVTFEVPPPYQNRVEDPLLAELYINETSYKKTVVSLQYKHSIARAPP